MASDIVFVGQFIATKAGKTGLTVTVDVDRYTISDGTRSELVTAGSATEGRRGLYHYRLAAADLSLYQYVATFITSDATVDQQHIAAIGLVVPDVLVSSRNATTPPSAADNATAAAAAILVTPANKLATGAAGVVTPSGGTINSVLGSIGGNVEGKVLGGGAGTITGVGTSANVTYSAGIALTGRLAQASDLTALGNAGLYSYSATVDDGANPLDGVFIQCATDAGFTNVIATTYSNASGAYTVRSDQAGTHYLRFHLAGWNFSDETVTLV